MNLQPIYDCDGNPALTPDGLHPVCMETPCPYSQWEETFRHVDWEEQVRLSYSNGGVATVILDAQTPEYLFGFSARLEVLMYAVPGQVVSAILTASHARVTPWASVRTFVGELTPGGATEYCYATHPTVVDWLRLGAESGGAYPLTGELPSAPYLRYRMQLGFGGVQLGDPMQPGDWVKLALSLAAPE